MIPLRARVRNGRLVLDEPTDLPEGTELELVPIDSRDDLADEDRSALHAALARSAADAQDHRVVVASDVFRKLRGGG
jgi:hypothetical protein